jgi:DNA-binding CsgD family transcriptional regulator
MYMTQPKMEPTPSSTEAGRRQTGMPSPVLAAMNFLNLGVLIVDSECRIIFANDYANEILNSLKVTRFKNSLATDRAHTANPLDRRLREAISDGNHRSANFLALNGARANSLIVQIVPYGNNNSGQETTSGSILFVSDSSIKSNLDLRPAAKLYGLTPAELRLLEALLSGEKVGQYAQKEHITLNTVKGHLAQLFRKTQTSRQSELVLCVLANPVFRLASRNSATPRTEGSTW